MKESYPDDIMICFVQGFNDRENGFNKSREAEDCYNLKRKKRNTLAFRDSINTEPSGHNAFELRRNNSLLGKSFRDAGRVLPEVKRSFSDRFSVITDAGGRKRPRGLLTIRKTWSTGNFAASAGGGCGAPRSAPATPLQLEPHSRSKHDKNVVKPLSGSAPSVRVGSASGDEAKDGKQPSKARQKKFQRHFPQVGPEERVLNSPSVRVGSASGDEAKDGKQPSKARQKKFQRHFPQVGPEERVLNYYSCALVGDLLLQGHLYITKNYFAFYSNVFGYVTKLLIPTTSVLRITKEKVARIIPNAVGVCTRDERHVFGSLLSRDSTYKLMMHVWKTTRVPELAVPEPQELRGSEIEASEYSPEDDSSSGGADHVDAPAAPVRPEPDAIIAAAGAAVIQPALLTGSAPPRRAPRCTRALLLALAALLSCSAAYFAYRLYCCAHPLPSSSSGEELYSELVRWRARLHGRAASELHAFLSTNLLLLTKVRQSLEALSGVILTDMAQGADINIDVPNTVFS